MAARLLFRGAAARRTGAPARAVDVPPVQVARSAP